MSLTAKELHETGERLFSKRTSLVALWQEQAENFYVERADFTVSRNMGDTLAENLTTSYPIMVRRDLGNSFGSMLRPIDQEWFHTGVQYDDEDNESKRWLEWAATTQRRAMYDRSSLFVRATKEGDHDYATFGQNVISIELNRARNALLYRCWHLRDVAWYENEEGKIGGIFRKWKPTARDLKRMFKDRVHKSVADQAQGGQGRDPFKEFNCMHIVVEADMYSGKQVRQPYVSIYYDIDNDHVMEDVGSWTQVYNIARWQTVSGSQYAYSPATVAALPEARLLQSMTLTLLEAGEKATNPPMIGVEEALRSDLNIFAGGFTAVDSRYDDRLDKVLRPLTTDKYGMPIGFDMQRDSRALIADCFFLNKLNLPNRAPEMTAYEVGQRVQQYIRDAMPLFEPMENDYNGGLCEQTFELMLRNGAFGAPDMMPKRLRGKEIQFKFESPLHDAIERRKVSVFMEGRAMLAEAIALDPSCRAMVDAKTALRDGLTAIRFPAKWVNSEEKVRAAEDADRAAAEQQQILQSMQAGADVATTMSESAKNQAAAQSMALAA